MNWKKRFEQCYLETKLQLIILLWYLLWTCKNAFKSPYQLHRRFSDHFTKPSNWDIRWKGAGPKMTRIFFLDVIFPFIYQLINKTMLFVNSEEFSARPNQNYSNFFLAQFYQITLAWFPIWLSATISILFFLQLSTYVMKKQETFPNNGPFRSLSIKAMKVHATVLTCKIQILNSFCPNMYFSLKPKVSNKI